MLAFTITNAQFLLKLMRRQFHFITCEISAMNLWINYPRVKTINDEVIFFLFNLSYL